MKQIFLYILSIGFAGSLFASENEKKVKSEIKEVKIFLRGAEVSCIGNTNLSIGMVDLVFDNLSPNINESSIQVKGQGDFTILAVLFRMNYLNPQIKTREIILLEDSLTLIQNKLELQQALRSVYENEESMLLSNKSIGGINTGVSSVELEKIAAIFRIRLSDLKIKQLESRGKEKKLNEQISNINKQLSEQNAKRNKNTGEIVVSVNAKNNGEARLNLSYMVSDAGWSPQYDIHAIDSKSPIQLSYRANVFQNSSVDWNKVKLTLSTGNPSLSGNKPILHPWRLSYYTPPNFSNKSTHQNVRILGDEGIAASSVMKQSEEEIIISDNASNYTEITEGTTNFEYEIGIPYNIPSDAKNHSVEIQNFSMPATYKYYVAPKLDRDAFLMARLNNWEQYNLLPGDANIYFERTYVGKSLINTLQTNDTLDISLGRDKNVNITRVLMKEFTEKKIIGMNKKEIYTYEISLRNKKKQNIEIEIEDQIPLSPNNEIEVELLESSDATYDKEKGKLIWDIKLTSTEDRKIKFSYSVKYPKDKRISNLK